MHVNAGFAQLVEPGWVNTGAVIKFQNCNFSSDFFVCSLCHMNSLYNWTASKVHLKIFFFLNPGHSEFHSASEKGFLIDH